MSEASAGLPGAGDTAVRSRLQQERVERDFTHHPPTSTAVSIHHEYWREEFKTLASQIVKHLPFTRERSEAITQLEVVLFWVNACVAREQVEMPGWKE